MNNKNGLLIIKKLMYPWSFFGGQRGGQFHVLFCSFF